MTEPTFGIVINRSSDEPRPVVPSDMSVLGLVLPSNDADAAVFPVNQPITFNSNDSAYLTKIGTGPLAKTVAIVNRQLDELQVAARVVAVRVAQGADINETTANIIGSQNANSGLYALLTAGQVLGVIPRIIGAPGFTGHFNRTDGETAVSSAAKAAGNTGGGTLTLADPAYGNSAEAGIYRVRCIGGARSASAVAKGGNTGNGTVGSLTADSSAAVGAWRVVCGAADADGGAFSVIRPDGTVEGVAIVGEAYDGAINFTIADGANDFAAGDEFTVTVAASVPANGGVFSVTAPGGAVLANATVGVAYTGDHVKFTIADVGTDFAIGDGFDVTVAITGGVAEANPICAVLPSICNALLAHAVVGGPATSKQDADDWRETLNSGRLIPVDNYVKVSDGVNTEEIDLAAAVMGIGVRVDHQHQGVPSHSWANQPIYGIVGLRRYDAFSLTDGATTAQELLANNIGVAVRGELGVETAIASSGFVYLGTDNTSEDTLWQFYNISRMRDFIHLGVLKTERKRLGVSNITPHSVQAILNDIEFFLRDLKADWHILGYKVGFEKDKNSPEELRLGHLRIFFQAEEPPPLRKLTIDSRRYRPALEEMIETLATQANTLVA
jgi:phage tail sheath protein FI